MWYTIVKDQSCHSYIISFDKQEEWDDWLHLDEDDEASWYPPDWAKSCDGVFKFKEYELC